MRAAASRIASTVAAERSCLGVFLGFLCIYFKIKQCEYEKRVITRKIKSMKNQSGIQKFLILCFVVFCGFLTIGIPLAVLPNQIHDVLGFSAFIVGIIIGLQSGATVLTRHIAGSSADRRGAKPTVQKGLFICILSGVIYFTSTFARDAHLSLLLLAFARLVLGLGESFLITGALTWGIGLVGFESSGKVMAWNGIAMYGALSFGAPLGLFLNSHFRIESVFLATIFCPLFALIISTVIPAVHAQNLLAEREPFLKILKVVWLYGAGLAFGTIGFGALSTFIVLYFQTKGFGDAGTAMLIFGGFYIAVRVVAGHLPDKTGGGMIAIVSLFIEACGQGLIWLAPNAWVAYLGAALIGAGFSLVFPSLGIQAAKSIPAHSRGSAFGAFFAFFDIALGLTAPLCGGVASYFSYASIYFVGMIACLLGVGVAVFLHRSPESCA
jgi:predicted MFS family arabinose efflux permease